MGVSSEAHVEEEWGSKKIPLDRKRDTGYRFPSFRDRLVVETGTARA
jgi:hypothetical protein